MEDQNRHSKNRSGSIEIFGPGIADDTTLSSTHATSGMGRRPLRLLRAVGRPSCELRNLAAEESPYTDDMGAITLMEFVAVLGPVLNETLRIGG
jgi:hypothetical protein